MTARLSRSAHAHRQRIALVDGAEVWTYQRLLAEAVRVGAGLHALTAGKAEPRVCYLVSPSPEWAAVQWGVWMARGVAVPMAVSHPVPELRYVLNDTEPVIAIADGPHLDRLREAATGTGVTVLGLDEIRRPAAVEEVPTLSADANRAAMILYTSGTTSQPKGVVSSHGNIEAQVGALVDAWGWSEGDRILHVLPLHHVHGINNVLSCALAAGACCEFAHPFDPIVVWDRLSSGDVTVFMAVPTVYGRLIGAWESADAETRERWSAGVQPLRLMVSGSAALPVTTLERWRELTGHTLLERYGMTEIGMGLSNPLRGERRAGTVGMPLPGVIVRLVDERGRPVPGGSAGQIQVRGPQVFREYWGRPEATAAAFRDGWFQTGDQAVVEDGYFRILGRESVDIIKTGGYKVSALEIESHLLAHPSVREAAVVGVPDVDWGERVCAAIVCGDSPPESESLRTWCKERMAPYKVPRAFKHAKRLPRNAMGKVTKAKVRELFEN